MNSSQGYAESYLQQYQGGQCKSVAIAFIVLTIAAVIGRFYAKTKIEASLGMDDYLIIPALICVLGNSTLAIISVYLGGVGYHAAAVEKNNPDALLTWSKCLFGLEWLYAFATAFPKLSVLFFYLRIFPAKSFRACVYLLMLMVIGLCASIAFVALFQCSPIAFAWDKTIKGGTCIDELAYFRWITPPNLIIDVAMLVLPLPMVWRLHTSLSQKVGLTMIFLTGSVGIVSACIRMSVFFEKNAFDDATWTAVALVNWTVIEPSFYLIAACLPSFRPLFIQVIGRVRTRSSLIKGGEDRYWPNAAAERNAKFRRIDGGGLPESSITVSGGHTDRTVAVEWKNQKSDGIPLNSINFTREFHVDVG